MNSPRKLVDELRELDFQSAEFYAVAAEYFRRRVRSHRNCGRFFVLLGTLSWTLCFIHWGRWGLALSVLPGFLFFAGIGWFIISGAVRTAQLLHEADLDSNVVDRLCRLRMVAFSYRGDPVSVFVLKSTAPDDFAAQPGASPNGGSAANDDTKTTDDPPSVI